MFSFYMGLLCSVFLYTCSATPDFRVPPRTRHRMLFKVLETHVLISPVKHSQNVIDVKSLFLGYYRTRLGFEFDSPILQSDPLTIRPHTHPPQKRKNA